MSNLWCAFQGEDEEGVYCTAHLVEDRILACPYKSRKDYDESTKLYKCVDMEPLESKEDA